MDKEKKVVSKRERTEIPYNTSVGILEKMLNELKNTGNEGINLKTLWDRIDEASNQNRSYTLTMAKFLKLVDTDNTKVWLTSLGRSIGYISGAKKNELLARNLPETYMTMFKWIKYTKEGEMQANDIKIKFINTFGNLSSPVVLDRAIASFLNYCQYIGLLTYAGKGRGAKATLTDFGKKVFDTFIEEVKPESSKERGLIQPSYSISSLPDETEAIYPIKIITRDRVFDWDIKTESDLSVIDSVISSIKEGWKNKSKGVSRKEEKLLQIKKDKQEG